MTDSKSALFETAFNYPDPDARRRLGRLVGLDNHKERLSRQLSTLIHPDGVEQWAQMHGYDQSSYLLDTFTSRPPLVILEGDVGCGKTELAETIPDSVARLLDLEITLFPLSLSTRGQGLVGEMTKLVSSAFEEILATAKKLAGAPKPKGGAILLIDEADALAQTREASQMHHEDKAGVNALIRGINRLSAHKLPVAVIMCTNRLSALDPAIHRRAADVIKFERPNENQRKAALSTLLDGIKLTSADIQTLVKLSGHNEKRDYGATYSDITQKFLPTLVLSAYPNQPITIELAKSVMQQLEPTPPFRE
jgi:SpoVK/Ycf46/Vps4 family AAA+-type ATPase